MNNTRQIHRITRHVIPARQWLIIALSCLILSACRSVSTHTPKGGQQLSGPRSSDTMNGSPAAPRRTMVSPPAPNAPVASDHGASPGTVRPVTYLGPITDPSMGVSAMSPAGVQPASAGPFAAAPTNVPCYAWPTGYPGLPTNAWGGHPGPFYPEDEYICDGGDQAAGVMVGHDFSVHGIDPEDTVAHYDTIDATTHVQASNRVCIYAPRFAAVRQVSGAFLSEQQEYLAGVTLPEGPVNQERYALAENVTQPIETQRNVAFVAPQGFRDRNLALGLENARFLQGIDFDLLPYENLAFIRRGEFDASEKARLAQAVTAAKTWTMDQNPEVLIAGKAAFESAGGTAPVESFRYEMPKGKPRLRIVKLASKQNALPGETVEFTLRFDNVGDQPIGNVTILDRLTPRLEYVADSAKCTLDADFFTVDIDEGTSTILRWEIKDPLKVSEGGVIRFQCKVR